MTKSEKFKMLFAIIFILLTYGCSKYFDKYTAENKHSNDKNIKISTAISLKDCKKAISIS